MIGQDVVRRNFPKFGIFNINFLTGEQSISVGNNVELPFAHLPRKIFLKFYSKFRFDDQIFRMIGMPFC